MKLKDKNIYSDKVDQFLGQLFGTYKFQTNHRNYLEMVRFFPYLKSGVKLRNHYCLSMLGQYHHDDDNIRDEVRSSLNSVPGSLIEIYFKIFQFTWVGFSYTERSYKTTANGKAAIDRIKTVNPLAISDFVRSNGVITGITLETEHGSKLIPYTGIHLKCDSGLSYGDEDRGVSLLEPVEKFWELYKLILAALTIANQRQATPLVGIKTDTRARIPLLNESGQPVIVNGQPVTLSVKDQLYDDLKNADNSSLIIIDRLDEAFAISQQTDGKLLHSSLHYLHTVIDTCLDIPLTVRNVSQSGVGDSGLSEGHREIFEIFCESTTNLVSSALIENLIKPLLAYNYPNEKGYGTFPVNRRDPRLQVILSSMSDLMRSGLYEDIDKVMLREHANHLLGLS